MFLILISKCLQFVHRPFFQIHSLLLVHWPLCAFTWIRSCSSCETLHNHKLLVFFLLQPTPPPTPQSCTASVFSLGVSGGRTRVLCTGLVLGAHVWTGYSALWSLHPPTRGVNATTLLYYTPGLCADNPHFWATRPRTVLHRLNFEKTKKKAWKDGVVSLLVSRPWSCQTGCFGAICCLPVPLLCCHSKQSWRSDPAKCLELCRRTKIRARSAFWPLWHPVNGAYEACAQCVNEAAKKSSPSKKSQNHV